MPTRRRLALVLAVAAGLYLTVAIWPFQLETRLVGLGGATVFGLLFAAERRRACRRTPGQSHGGPPSAAHRIRMPGAGGHRAHGGGVASREPSAASEAAPSSQSDDLVMSAMLMLVAALGIVGLVLLARRDPSDASTDQAITAALAATRGGHATEVERVRDRGATWEVDVITRDGTAVDVRLDKRFGLVAIEEEVEDADGR